MTLMIRHALVQFKPHKSQLSRNLEQLSSVIAQLESEQIDVLTLPETALTGYFLQAGVREQALTAPQLFTLLQGAVHNAGRKEPLDICLGFYERDGGSFFNSALYAEFNTERTGIRHVHRKMFLPTYGVFDEERYVSRGWRLDAFGTRFGRAGMLICEDAWHASTAAVLALKGADILYIPTASPVRDLVGAEPANARRWEDTAKGIAAEHGVYVLTTCLTGFEGGKGFSGMSHMMDPYGVVVAKGELFSEQIIVTDVHLESIQAARYESPLLSDLRANLPELVRAFQEVGEPQ
jgi:N-carbamoylputrescine amidase